jgi:hypothetical protein
MQASSWRRLPTSKVASHETAYSLMTESVEPHAASGSGLNQYSLRTRDRRAGVPIGNLFDEIETTAEAACADPAVRPLGEETAGREPSGIGADRTAYTRPMVRGISERGGGASRSRPPSW